jgi:hypothetical protein
MADRCFEQQIRRLSPLRQGGPHPVLASSVPRGRTNCSRPGWGAIEVPLARRQNAGSPGGSSAGVLFLCATMRDLIPSSAPI